MNGLIYFDNAATSYPKPKNVITSVSESLMRCGNPGRSGHELSLYSMRAVYSCREAICSFFNFSNPENVVFTYNTTYALNMAIKGIMANEGEIVLSNLEHNSVIRPVTSLCLENSNITHKVFNALGNDDEIISNFKNALSPETKLCVMTMCSNVTGKITPYKRISDICKKRGIKLIFDAAQYAGHLPLDLSTLYFSAVCFAAHKSLFGIMGCGFAIFSPKENPEAIIEGGNGVESLSPFQQSCLPEKLESGTLGVPAVIALHEGLKHLNSIGLSYISDKCSYLENRISSGLSQMKNITLYTNDKYKVCTVLFNIRGIASEKAAQLLSEKGICTRAGLHCAPLCHKALGTIEAGAVRASLSHFNTGKDIDTFLNEVSKIAQ